VVLGYAAMVVAYLWLGIAAVTWLLEAAGDARDGRTERLARLVIIVVFPPIVILWPAVEWFMRRRGRASDS
jgi:hypothetical protein